MPDEIVPPATLEEALAEQEKQVAALLAHIAEVQKKLVDLPTPTQLSRLASLSAAIASVLSQSPS